MAAVAKFNKGDVSEGILAAAITCRFISKTKKISESEVINLISRLNKAKAGTKGKTTITSFDSMNKNPKILDTVICKVNLAEVNMNAFLNKSIYKNPDIKALVSAATSYANGKYIMEHADLVYNNNQKNTIEISAEGLLDQTGTKVDLKVLIDGKHVSVGVSLKAGDVGQFGQVGGSKWESMVSLFEPLGIRFGVTTRNNYEKLLSEKALAPALQLAYFEAYKQLKATSQLELRKKIANLLIQHATLNEENVVLVQLVGGAAKVYNFQLLRDKLIGQEIEVFLTSGKTDKLSVGGFIGSGSMTKDSIPKLDFKINNKVLFTIRLKLEGNRVSSKGKNMSLVVRNYIEKGPVATQLVSEKL